MPRVVAFLDDGVIKNLKELYKNSDKSLSKIISELVDIGYRVKQHHEVQKVDLQEEKKAELTDKHTEYLLRTMAVVADTYRCVRNEKSKYKEEDIDNVLDTIISNTQSYINGKLGKNR
ncbi:MAG: hypothetical protein ACD_21C00187G0005 [uncultured bacterium]|nr:MAG: hypothetical protein ACD_21C00187G0005 [uncultured bacterium]